MVLFFIRNSEQTANAKEMQSNQEAVFVSLNAAELCTQPCVIVLFYATSVYGESIYKRTF